MLLNYYKKIDFNYLSVNPNAIKILEEKSR